MIGKGGSAGLMGLLCGAALLGNGPAFAQAKQWDDKSIACLMDYTWRILPGKFTNVSGRITEVDKTKKKEVMIPLDAARRAINVARYFSYAEMCNLPEEQEALKDTFMRRERATNQWTDQQMLFMHQLLQTAVFVYVGNKVRKDLQTGKEAALTQPEIMCEFKCTGDVCDVVNIKPHKSERPCSDATRAQLQREINTYIGATPAAKTAEPARGPQKK
jgi:hypothetical protein